MKSYGLFANISLIDVPTAFVLLFNLELNFVSGINPTLVPV